MRRLISLTVLAIALAVPAVGYAVAGGSDDGTLSVKNGIGRVYVNINGSVVVPDFEEMMNMQCVMSI